MLPWLRRIIRVALVKPGKPSQMNMAARLDMDLDLVRRGRVDYPRGAMPLSDFSTLDELGRIIDEANHSSPDHQGKP